MSSDSQSPSSTPMLLTPESTGSAEQASNGAKKARRQTAFYPNMNSSNKPQKPFSRSAAKRESVMTLGSIEHLQHYFTKTGIAAKNNPLNKPGMGLVPAIGGKSHVKNVSSKAIPEFQLPPSPAIPNPVSRPIFPPYVKTFETNPETLLPGVVDDLRAVTQAWALDPSSGEGGQSEQNPDLLGVEDKSKSPATGFEVLSVLKTTTRAIRSVRNYVLSLPDESTGEIRAQFRSSVASGSNPTPKKPSPKTPQKDQNADPLTLIRRSALDVLTSLRELEEKSRVPLSDDAYDAQSDHGSSQGHGSHSRVASPSSNSMDLPIESGRHSRVASPSSDSMNLPTDDPDASISYSYIRVQGRHESVPVWENENSSDSDEEKLQKREHWDERLVLGGGWLYKQDVKLSDLDQEQEVVKRYIDSVDSILFGGFKGGKRGWERERERVAKKEKSEAKMRRTSSSEGDPLSSFQFPPPKARRVVSTGMMNTMLSEEPEQLDVLEESGEESVDDDELPEWAKRSTFMNDPLGRTHALLTNLLPVTLLPALTPPSDRNAFLQCLSSGQILCTAYNTAVRRSRKPWGYISKDAIHDIVALEQAAAEDLENKEKEKDKEKEKEEKEKGKRSWTFRRTDNLRLWAAALKLRYLLPVVTPGLNTHANANTPGSSNTPLTSPSPSKTRFPNEPPIYFDAALVARRDEGWEVVLEVLLLRWVDAVVEERRGDR